MIAEAEKGYFGLEYAGILIFAPRQFSCYLVLKLLTTLHFCQSAALAAGEFTVYKRAA